MAKLSTTDIFGELKVSLNAKVTGDLTVNGGITTTGINFLGTTGTNSRTLLQSVMADNDFFRILVGGTASNSGFVELATADDGAEPIYVRQYTGVFTSLTRSATLLDSNGNTSFPGTVTAANLRVTGAITATGDVTAFASDERLKTEFVKIENSLELTKQLDTGYYYFNELAAGFGFDSSKRQVGVKAGQLEKLLPEVVAPAPFDSGKDGSITGEHYLTVKYEKLTALLIQNIKDLTAEVEKLKNNK